MNVLLHRSTRAPGEVAADEQADTVARLQLDHLQPIEPDEVAQHFGFGEQVAADDFLEQRAIEDEPGHEEQLRIGHDLLLLDEREPVGRRGALVGTLQDLPQTQLQQFANLIDPL